MYINNFAGQYFGFYKIDLMIFKGRNNYDVICKFLEYIYNK